MAAHGKLDFRRHVTCAVLTPSRSHQHLALATDAPYMKSMFQHDLTKIWGRDPHVDDFFIPRVLPGKHGRLLVQYCFSANGDKGVSKRWVMFGHLLPSCKKVAVHESSPRVIGLPQLRMSVPVFPHDRKLKALGGLYQKGVLASCWKSLGLAVSDEIEDIELLGYRPERRAVLRAMLRSDEGARSIIIKLVRPNKAESLIGRLRCIEQADFHAEVADQITAPKLVCGSAEGIVLLEDIQHPSLHDLAESKHIEHGCVSAARVLNKLHRAPTESLFPYDADQEIVLLRRLSSLVGNVYPEIIQPLSQVFNWIRHLAPRGEFKVTAIHREFYDKQVLVGPSRTTLLDIDTLAKGDPAQDMGNFLAHLRLRALQAPEFAEAIESGRRSFCRAYGANHDSTLWERIRWWENAALLRLVCLYSLRPRWQNIALDILNELTSESVAPTFVSNEAY